MEWGAPLAERMRPRTLDEFVGQHDLVGEDSFLKDLLQKLSSSEASTSIVSVPSMVFWGPPGSGKTTLARLIAKALGMRLEFLSATSAGVKDVRDIAQLASQEQRLGSSSGLCLFIDEIHRFNKKQQDALLHYVEEGILTLIGATTENPGFSLNRALLSRVKVFTLKAHSSEDLKKILAKTLSDCSRGVGDLDWEWDAEAKELLVEYAAGDARQMLNTLEWISLKKLSKVDVETLQKCLSERHNPYSKSGVEHYEYASAFQKSIRHSDVQASLYYLACMLEGGEDPLFVARRLVRTASEDIGLADPQALLQAQSAFDAVERLGLPECDLALAQATAYLALAPKSNSLYQAMGNAKSSVRDEGPLAPPLHLKNATNAFMKKMGFGEGYQYDHDAPQGVALWKALPEKIQGRRFYRPSSRAFERELSKRMDYFEKLHRGEK